MNRQQRYRPLLAVLCLATLNLCQPIMAQKPPELDLRLYAGLRITGVVGTIYSVEYAADLAGSSDWRCLAFLRLPATNYLWTDPTVPAVRSRFYHAVEFAPPANLAFIPPGTFRMGSPASEVGRNPSDAPGDEGPQTDVTISHGFWMSKHEVTQGEYLSVMGTNPSKFKGDTNQPVDSVSWFNATNYCSKLTRRERAAGQIPTNAVYRLPTEAEWEYACRAQTSTRFNYGDDLDAAKLSDYAWYDDNSEAMSHPVGQKLPNAWGLYDMHGNLAEWCQDWYRTYPGGIALDPQGPATGSARVARGGLWFRPANYSRSAFRIAIDPEATLDGAGFRIVLAPGES